uniref:Helicase n=1 Tax=viral metagenome TaxID=1070528 RepID=A0A6C0CCA6_9ZZZZ
MAFIDKSVAAKLLPFQPKHVENLIYSLTKYNRALDASDTGTGKTYTSIATAISMKLKLFVICPKSVITSWIKTFKILGAEYYGVANYESLQNCKYYDDKSNKKAKCPFIKRIVDIGSEKGEFTYVWNVPDDMIIVFDEAHRCKNPKTQCHLLLYTLAKTTAKILMLSATVSDKPENFAIAGYALGLYPHLRSANIWMTDASKRYDGDLCIGIHNAIYPEYASRMRIRDLGKLFPDNQIVANCYDMDNSKEIEKEYKLIEDEVARLKSKEDNSGCALSRILYARMRIEQLKVPTIIEETKKNIEEGNSVAIFVNFTQTLKLLADEFDTKCIIFGEQSMQERNKNIDDFNDDRSRLIICNIKSGGIGISLHDTHGQYPRVSIISPSYSAQDVLQSLGRIYRANTKTAVRQRIIYCSGTVEENICEKMKEKITNIAKLNDADTFGYQIDGLMDDPYGIGIDMHANLSDFDKLFLKIEVLNIKKERLTNEIKETDVEIQNLINRVNMMTN